MQPINFIASNILRQLKAKGYSEEVSVKCANDAAKQWAELSHSPEGPMYNFLLKEALKSAEGESNGK